MPFWLIFLPGRKRIEYKCNALPLRQAGVSFDLMDFKSNFEPLQLRSENIFYLRDYVVESISVNMVGKSRLSGGWVFARVGDGERVEDA